GFLPVHHHPIGVQHQTHVAVLRLEDLDGVRVKHVHHCHDVSWLAGPVNRVDPVQTAGPNLRRDQPEFHRVLRYGSTRPPITATRSRRNTRHPNRRDTASRNLRADALPLALPQTRVTRPPETITTPPLQVPAEQPQTGQPQTHDPNTKDKSPHQE